ncbi:MAG: hypothetical protein HQL33_02895 [Alphaproteobacteria bacterium]|nr:hypothetical protein [Alphaproteobacteria bacterium]MBF0128920.1 hypothetical protein [Alphaproteobacteria bacterium]
MTNPYDQNSQASAAGSESARRNERTALLATARDLRLVVDDWDNMKEQLDAPLERNQMLWAVLSTEVTENTSLPDELRQNLLNLALFVFQTSLKLVTQPNPKDVMALVNINLSLAEGLSGGQ